MQRFLTLFFLIVIVDQTSKSFSQYFGFETVINSGISFALLGGHTQVVIILLSLALLVLLSLTYGYFWAKNPATAGLFFGGAFSNVVDRLWHGGVRDWIQFPFLELKNNLADYAIAAALLVIIWKLWAGGEHD